MTALVADIGQRVGAAVAAFANDTQMLPPLTEIAKDPLLRSITLLRREADYRHQEREMSSQSIFNAIEANAPASRP